MTYPFSCHKSSNITCCILEINAMAPDIVVPTFQTSIIFCLGILLACCFYEAVIIIQTLILLFCLLWCCVFLDLWSHQILELRWSYSWSSTTPYHQPYLVYSSENWWWLMLGNETWEVEVSENYVKLCFMRTNGKLLNLSVNSTQ